MSFDVAGSPTRKDNDGFNEHCYLCLMVEPVKATPRGGQMLQLSASQATILHVNHPTQLKESKKNVLLLIPVTFDNTVFKLHCGCPCAG